MERVALDYEGSMRPGAFQCCTNAESSVTGFRMHLQDFPLGGKKATTGCVGDCQTGCGPIFDFTYSGWYLDFVFAVDISKGNRKLIKGITVRDYSRSGGSATKTQICSGQGSQPGIQEVVLAPSGIPVGFEYSYSASSQSFSSLTLIGNMCPFHDKHLRTLESPSGQILSFYLVSKEFEINQIKNGPRPNFTGSGDAYLAFPTPLVVRIQDDEHLEIPNGKFFRKVLVVNDMVHYALGFEDKSRYDLEEPREKITLRVWSMFDSRESQANVAIPYISAEEDDQSNGQYFSLQFTNDRNKWPQAARHDYLKVQLSYGDYFSYSQVIEVSFVDFDPADLGSFSDFNSCYFEQPALSAFVTDISQDSVTVYTENRLSEADFKISHRSDGFVEQQTVVMCCSNAKGAVTAIDARKMFFSDVEEYWTKFVQANAGARCKGAIEQSNKVQRYVSFKHQDGFYVDFALYNQVDLIWKSACQGLVSTRTPIYTDTVKMQFIEVSDNGSLVGISSVEETLFGENGDVATQLVHISLVFNRCHETPLTALPTPTVVVIVKDEPPQSSLDLTELDFNLSSAQASTTLEAKSLATRASDFMSLGYCPSSACLFENINRINLPIGFSNDLIQVPAWDAAYWDFNKLIYTTLLQNFEVTQGFRFQFARRLFVIIYAIGDLTSEIELCGLKSTNRSAAIEELTYFVESGTQTPLELNDIECPSTTRQLLAKLNKKEITRIVLINAQTGERDFSLGSQTSLTFTESAAGKTYLVEQETELYYSNVVGYLRQDDNEIATDLALSRILMTKPLLEVRVESCRDLLVDLVSPLSDMTTQALASQNVVQTIPNLVTLDGESFPDVCLQGMTFKVVLDSRVVPFLQVESGKIVLSAPSQSFLLTEATLQVRYGAEADSVLLREAIFFVSAEEAETRSEVANIAPIFSESPLPIWEITNKVNETMTYELPDVVDPDSAVLMVHIKGLDDIPTLRIQSLKQLSVIFAQETKVKAKQYQVTVVIGDGKAKTEYPLVINVTEAEPSQPQLETQPETLEGDETETPVDIDQTEFESGEEPDTTDPMSETETIFSEKAERESDLEPLEQQEVLAGEKLTELQHFSFNPWKDARKGGQRSREAQILCIPLKVRATTDGEVYIMFGQQITLNSTSAEFLEEVQSSGSIQVSMISDSKPSSPTNSSLTWTLEQQAPNELLFQLEFGEPDQISSSSLDADQIQVVFVKTESFLRCSLATEAQAARRRRLADDQPFVTSIPPFYSILVDLPPQKGANSTAVAIAQAIENLGNSTETAVYSSFSISQALKLPMQFVWAGINSVQLISHLPINQIIFPVNSIDFFTYLATVVSFDIFPPTERYDFGFSETEPYSLAFEMLDYETVNFFDALGSISIIAILIVARIVLQPAIVFLIDSICGVRCSCCRRNFALGGPLISNILIRFLLETFLELVISSLLGITLEESILAEEMNEMDWAALYGAYITMGLWIAFTLFVSYVTLVSSSSIVKIRRNQLRDFTKKVRKEFYEGIENETRFSWVFRSKTFIEKGQMEQQLRRGRSLQPKQIAEKIQLSEQRQKQNMSVDERKVRRFDDSEGAASVAKASSFSLKTSSMRDQLSEQDPQLIKEDIKADEAAKHVKRLESEIISESFIFSDEQIESQEPKIIEETPRRQPSQATQTMQTANEDVFEVGVMRYPGWYLYVSELFLHLDHKEQISLTVYLIFLIRRVAFVVVALYVVGSPAFQTMAFVQCSMFQCIVLVSQLPYETPLFNALEILNEFVVLSIGYHVIVLISDGLDVDTRLNLGVSMMVVITTMIGINGLNWIYQMIRQVCLKSKRCYYRRLRSNQRRKQLQRQTLLRESKKKAQPVDDVKHMHRRQGSQQGLLICDMQSGNDQLLSLGSLGFGINQVKEEKFTPKKDRMLLRVPLPENDSKDGHWTIETSNRKHQGKQAIEMTLLARSERDNVKVGMRSMTIPSATKLKAFSSILPSEVSGEEDSNNDGGSNENARRLQTTIRVLDYTGLSVSNFNADQLDDSDRFHVSVNEIDFEQSSRDLSDQCHGPHTMIQPGLGQKAVLGKAAPVIHPEKRQGERQVVAKNEIIVEPESQDDTFISNFNPEDSGSHEQTGSKLQDDGEDTR